MNTEQTAEQSQIIPDIGTHESPQVGRLPDAPAEAPKVEEAKPLSTRQALEKAMDEAEGKAKAEAKGDKTEDDKAAPEKAKAEESKAEKPRGEGGKFAKAETAEADQSAAAKPATGQEGGERRQSEGKHSEPPARFLPESRAKWANVPNEVKAEFHRVSQEYEQEATKHKATVERYESLRQYDEMARNNGRDLKDSLVKMSQIEQALARSPVQGLEMILREIGPRKTDGSPVSLYELAQHVSKLTPQQYQQNIGYQQQQAQQRQPQSDPKVAQLEQTVSQLQGMIAAQQANPIIQKFASDHPDYHSLEQSIATVLKSGIIEQTKGSGLTPEQKLAEAYRIAGGQYSPSHHAPQVQEPPAPTHAPSQDRPVDPDGQKSVRGAPTNGQTAQAARRFKSNREALEAAFSGQI